MVALIPFPRELVKNGAAEACLSPPLGEREEYGRVGGRDEGGARMMNWEPEGRVKCCAVGEERRGSFVRRRFGRDDVEGVEAVQLRALVVRVRLSIVKWCGGRRREGGLARF